MNRLLTFSTVVLVSILLSACLDNSDREKAKSTINKIKGATKSAKAYKDLTDQAHKAAEDYSNLAEKEPVEQSALKEWLPDKINGFKRTKYSTGQLKSSGVASLNSEFTDADDNKEGFTLEVIDGGGSLGSAMVAAAMRKVDSEQEEETEHGYKRTTEKNGYKVYEEQDDQRNTSGLELIEGKRFYVKLKGKNMTADDLWSVIEHLNLNALSSLK